HRAESLVKFQRIGDAKLRIGFDLQPLLAAKDDLFGRRFDGKRPSIVIDDAVEQGRLDLQTGLPDIAHGFAQANEKGLLTLFDDEKTVRQNPDDSGDGRSHKENRAGAHHLPPWLLADLSF